MATRSNGNLSSVFFHQWGGTRGSCAVRKHGVLMPAGLWGPFCNLQQHLSAALSNRCSHPGLAAQPRMLATLLMVNARASLCPLRWRRGG